MTVKQVARGKSFHSVTLRSVLLSRRRRLSSGENDDDSGEKGEVALDTTMFSMGEEILGDGE